MSMHILVVSGPNLNMLGKREPQIYGSVTLDQIHARLRREAESLECSLTCFQSNHEGAIIDFFQQHFEQTDGALLNPGGLTHSSVSLHDTVKSLPFPVIEVHLSNIHAREAWRSHSVTAAAARGQVLGLGWLSYLTALRGLAALLRDESP